MGLSQLVFYLFGGLAVAGSVLMITRRNPVHAAMYLVLALFSIAVIFVVLGAHFLAALQVLLYAGAILVLFLFVIMLLNLGHEFVPDLKGRFWWLMAGGIAAVLGIQLLAAFGGRPEGETAMLDALMESRGVVGAVAEPLFTTYLVAVEITGLLLLVAMIGAVVLARREG